MYGPWLKQAPPNNWNEIDIVSSYNTCPLSVFTYNNERSVISPRERYYLFPRAECRKCIHALASPIDALLIRGNCVERKLGGMSTKTVRRKVFVYENRRIFLNFYNTRYLILYALKSNLFVQFLNIYIYIRQDYFLIEYFILSLSKVYSGNLEAC